MLINNERYIFKILRKSDKDKLSIGKCSIIQDKMSPSFVQTRQFVQADCNGSHYQNVSVNITIITFLLFKDPKLKRKQSP